MDGITVLSEKLVTETMTSPGWSWFDAFLAIIIIALLCTLKYIRDDLGYVVVWAVTFSFIVVTCVGCFLTGNKKEISYYEYKVLIDESVHLLEFNEKYEIIDQEGSIYTVIERKAD